MSRFFLLVSLVLLAALAPSCSSGFGSVSNPPHLQIALNPGDNTGTIEKPLGLLINIPTTYRITVTALDASGNVDPTFNSYVRISAKPGAIGSLSGPDTSGRNIQLHAGVSVEVPIQLTNAYGTTYILADDLGYLPVDPLINPPPQCSDGIDNDGDGLIDYPADPGCAFANDDSETGGSYGEGTSPPIFYELPRIADLRGLLCDGANGCTGDGRTPYPHEQVGMETGFSELTNSYSFNTVVTRISQNGFYVTDLADTRGGFQSLFAYNFSAPPRMRVCDRMKTFAGTPSEFFGFTQLSYPTWTLEFWEPGKRRCLSPTPERITPKIINDVTALLPRTANLLRVETAPDKSQTLKVTPNFGPGDAQKVPGPNGTTTYAFTPDASNCDFDKNGKINSFTAGDPEGDCSTACTASPECTEYSNFLSRGTFRLTVIDATGTEAAIQADSSASAKFDPQASKGQTIRAFTGAMTYFSGGQQYTLEARCDDDIVSDLTLGPFLDDFACMTDADCGTDKGLPKDFVCAQLTDADGGKACRHVTPPAAGAPDPTPTLDPPPLACVFPRTIADLNPQ